MILLSLQISGVGPIGFSQQFESQHDIPSKVIYVQGGWLSSFVFKVTSTRFEHKDDFSGPNVLIRLKYLVEHVRTTMLKVTKGKKIILILRFEKLMRIHIVL